MNLFKPLLFRISKRTLLFEAALIWTFAGGMLLYRGSTMLEASSGFSWINITACICCGLLFFMLVFSKLSRKHINRIENLNGDKHYFYDFFNVRSYLMMIGMISIGVVLRKTALVPLTSLSLAYITMGIPLALSSLRFYFQWFCYNNGLCHQH